MGIVPSPLKAGTTDSTAKSGSSPGGLTPLIEGRENRERALLWGRDITEVRLKEEQLTKDANKFREIIELTQQGIWRINQKHQTTYVKPTNFSEFSQLMHQLGEYRLEHNYPPIT